MEHPSLPSPTPEEERQLDIVIEDWATMNSLQRAICTALLRGHETPESVASYIGADVENVRDVLPHIWGILRDASTNKLCFK